MADLSDLTVLERIFDYRTGAADRSPGNMLALHDAALVFAKAIIANTPRCADQSAAIRHVREALMTAGEALGLQGLV